MPLMAESNATPATLVAGPITLQEYLDNLPAAERLATEAVMKRTWPDYVAEYKGEPYKLSISKMLERLEDKQMLDLSGKSPDWQSHPVRSQKRSLTYVRPEQANRSPYWLLRVHANKGPRTIGCRTAGTASPTMFSPPAHAKNYPRAKTMFDMAKEELLQMHVYHVLWRDRKADNLVSTTVSPLFMFTHGMMREMKGADDVRFYIIDRRVAQDENGDPAKFYPALALCHHVNYLAYDDYGGPGDKNSVAARRLNHEAVAFGAVILPPDVLRAPSLEELLDAGLRELFPTLPKLRPGFKVVKLYAALLWARRSVYYKKAHAFTDAEVDTVFTCARLFNHGERNDRLSRNPPIMIVLLLCTGKRRHDSVDNKPLTERLKAMGYTGMLHSPAHI